MHVRAHEARRRSTIAGAVARHNRSQNNEFLSLDALVPLHLGFDDLLDNADSSVASGDLEASWDAPLDTVRSHPVSAPLSSASTAKTDTPAAPAAARPSHLSHNLNVLAAAQRRPPAVDNAGSSGSIEALERVCMHEQAHVPSQMVHSTTSLRQPVASTQEQQPQAPQAQGQRRMFTSPSLTRGYFARARAATVAAAARQPPSEAPAASTSDPTAGHLPASRLETPGGER